ncbi:PA domain-containing protein [Gordonia aurantiaca]|uniref:PA domain-containing protein n=1 Tax=Gordonia sp. B21 TaxID=3151852 RepID=UPI0032630ACF
MSIRWPNIGLSAAARTRWPLVGGPGAVLVGALSVSFCRAAIVRAFGAVRGVSTWRLGVTWWCKIGAEAAAYHVLAFEMVEPHHYPFVSSDEAGAIRWRAALDTRLGDQTFGFAETVGTVRDPGEFMSRSPAMKTSMAVAFVASTVLAGCGGAPGADRVADGAASPSSSPPGPAGYEYVASDVDAIVDGAPVRLRHFPFSIGAKVVEARLSSTLGDGCTEGGADVEDQFIVLPRDGCTFERKYDAARRAGASGLVITSSDPLPDGRR